MKAIKKEKDQTGKSGIFFCGKFDDGSIRIIRSSWQKEQISDSKWKVYYPQKNAIQNAGKNLTKKVIESWPLHEVQIDCVHGIKNCLFF